MLSFIILSVFLLSVIMLSVVKLIVIMLSPIMLSVIMLSAIMLSVIASSESVTGDPDFLCCHLMVQPTGNKLKNHEKYGSTTFDRMTFGRRTFWNIC
jgi:hypothetical protein